MYVNCLLVIKLIKKIKGLYRKSKENNLVFNKFLLFILYFYFIAQSLGIPFIETSALNSSNIEDAFIKIIK